MKNITERSSDQDSCRKKEHLRNRMIDNTYRKCVPIIEIASVIRRTRKGSVAERIAIDI